LRRKGAQVSVAANGEEALDMLNNAPFDLVLMDIHLPVMDGISVTQHIRSNPRLSGLPIIAVTADVFANENNRLIDAGMNGCLYKPLDEDKMCALIHQLIEPQQNSPIPGTQETPATQPLREHPLYEKLLRELAHLNEGIDSAYRGRETEALKDQVHQLHGVSALFKIDRLTPEVARLEQHLRAGMPLDLLGTELAEVARVVADLIREGTESEGSPNT